MKILLLISAFNSLSQAIYTKLRDKGYSVGVVFAINEQQIRREIEDYSPKLILAPFLKSFISKDIYEKYPTYIFHPGPIGDRGSNALEYALLNDTNL